MLGEPADWTLLCDAPDGWHVRYAPMEAPTTHGELVAVAEAARGETASVRIGVASLDREVSPNGWLAVFIAALGPESAACKWFIKKRGPRLLLARVLTPPDAANEGEAAKVVGSLAFKHDQVPWAEPMQSVTLAFHDPTDVAVPVAFAPQPSFVGEHGMRGERWISDFGGTSSALEAVELPTTEASSPEEAVDLVLRGKLGRAHAPLARVASARPRFFGTWLADGGQVEVSAVTEEWGNRRRVFCVAGPSRDAFVGAWLVNRRAHHLLVASQSDELGAVMAGDEPAWATEVATR